MNENVDLPEGVRFISWDRFIQRNPELFEDVVIGTLEKLATKQLKTTNLFGNIVPQTLTGYDDDALIKLIDQLQEYVNNPIVKGRINEK